MANQVHKTIVKFNKITPLKDTILVHGMDFNERVTSSGIIIPDDDMKSSGIRPRWAQVYAVGPKIDYLTPGQYILVAHGRWTRGISVIDSEGEKTIRKVDPKDILLVSDTPVYDLTFSDKLLV
jgi:co-chaperonin GroES (HSP10)